MLSIAGSDPSGGAGIQADIKVANMLGVYPCAVVSALTAQNSFAVSEVWPVEAHIFGAQLHSLLQDIRPDSIKIGLLPSSELIEIMEMFIREYNLVNIVVDPILSLSLNSFSPVETLMKAYGEKLFPLASVVTPNIPEAEAFEAFFNSSLSFLTNSYLLKGGHSNDDEICCDKLFMNGDLVRKYTHKRINTTNTHGSGCVLSSAIASFLALGKRLEDAVADAIIFTDKCILNSKDQKLGVGNYGPALI